MLVWTGRSRSGGGLEQILRDDGWVAVLRPGDGAGRHDAGCVDVHRPHHVDDDAATGGGVRRESGVVDNTGSVTTTTTARTSRRDELVAAPAIHIVKTADAAQVNAGDQIGFTLTV